MLFGTESEFHFVVVEKDLKSLTENQNIISYLLLCNVSEENGRK